MNNNLIQLALAGVLTAGMSAGALADQPFERPQRTADVEAPMQVAQSDADDDFAEWEQEITPQISDPFERINRGVFWFNDQADRFVIKPVAKGYDWLLPQPVKRGVSNVFDNLFTPVVAVSDLLQGKFQHSAEDVGRFVVNSTVGVVGIFDVATGWGLEKRHEDIGQAFGAWGIGTGPYLVLPILGPSNVRDGVGLVGNYFLQPQHHIADDETRWGVTILGGIDARYRLLDASTVLEQAALDRYAFVRSSYMQYRQNLVEDKDAGQPVPAASFGQ
ncbi:VacJ family lipoprotein [Immundisolibacter sp.]|uniref:MlaA family lipoprotein n=1 Tax=Immundisolibacter sp. TaxID=1934948 RepID=UPI003569AC87